MGKLGGAGAGIRNGCTFEGGVDAALQVGTGEMRFVSANGFCDLRADAHNGIERGHRLLKDHGDIAAADGAPIVFGA